MYIKYVFPGTLLCTYCRQFTLFFNVGSLVDCCLCHQISCQQCQHNKLFGLTFFGMLWLWVFAERGAYERSVVRISLLSAQLEYKWLIKVSNLEVILSKWHSKEEKRLRKIHPFSVMNLSFKIMLTLCLALPWYSLLV